MPSPAGHSIIGYILYKAIEKPAKPRAWWLLGLYLLAVNASDFDFILGLVIGDPNRYHRGMSHSFGFGILVGVGLGALMSLLKENSFLNNSIRMFAACSSHLVLDFLWRDRTFPFGVMLFWPIVQEYFSGPLDFLPDISRTSYSTMGFMVSLFSLHNLWTVFVECLFLLPAMMILFLLNRCNRKST